MSADAGRAVDRASRNAALVLGLTGPGDTVLYLLLPLYAAGFGVTLAEAGLLLAANRLVRIAGMVGSLAPTDDMGRARLA